MATVFCRSSRRSGVGFAGESVMRTRDTNIRARVSSQRTANYEAARNYVETTGAAGKRKRRQKACFYRYYRGAGTVDWRGKRELPHIRAVNFIARRRRSVFG